MAKLICPISGIRYSCDHVPVTIRMPHPIFSISSKKLLVLYARYLKGDLSQTDSYLLFLAYLNTIDSLEWRTACSLHPTSLQTESLVANNLAQLVSVLERTNTVSVSNFSQPGFIINQATSDLRNIKLYIRAWHDNIVNVNFNYAKDRELASTAEKIAGVEAKLQVLIFNGESKLTANKMAEWAHLVADFPEEDADRYRTIIRSCFNADKIFSYALTELKEVKDYCLANIELGSIYSHKLLEVLNHGIELNRNYLGYTIIPDIGMGSEATVLAIVAKAPMEEPNKLDYSTSVDYLLARLRYNVAKSRGER